MTFSRKEYNIYLVLMSTTQTNTTTTWRDVRAGRRSTIGNRVGGNLRLEGSNPSLSAIYGSVAQSVEQRTENPRVGGSIPSRATFNGPA